MIKLNFESKFKSINNTINYWKKRKLTPIRRITVVKSLLLPLLTHLFISLPSPTNEFMKQLNNTLYEFVWDGNAKIKQTVFTKNYMEGGLNMIDVNNYNKSMKIKWLRKLVACGKSCHKFMNNVIDTHKLFNFGMMYCEKIITNIRNDFWIDVLKSFMVFISKCSFTKLLDVVNMPLFFNSNILVDSKHIYNKILYDCGIRYVKDLLNVDGSFKNWLDIKTMTRNNVNFLNFYSITTSVKTFLSKNHILIKKDALKGCHNPSISSYFFHMLTKSNINKHVYNTLTYNDEIPSSRVKWDSLYNNINIDWKQVHGNVFKCTKDTYTQWFQTRIIHRIIPTNSLLFKMKLIDTNSCTFCKRYEETILHLFHDCEHTKSLINNIATILSTFDHTLQIDSRTLLLGTRTSKVPLDRLLLELKKYIYHCRNKQKIPSMIGFKNTLNLTLNIHKYTNTHEIDKCHMTIVEHVYQSLLLPV